MNKLKELLKLKEREFERGEELIKINEKRIYKLKKQILETDKELIKLL